MDQGSNRKEGSHQAPSLRVKVLIMVLQITLVYIGAGFLFAPSFYPEYYDHLAACNGAVSYSYNDYRFMVEHSDKAFIIEPELVSIVNKGFVCCNHNTSGYTERVCEKLWYLEGEET